MKNVFAQHKFPRLYGIYLLSDQQNPNNCLSKLSELNPDSNVNLLYEYYESLFQKIDQDNWKVFKEKLSGKVLGAHENARISSKGKKDKEEYSPIYPRFQGFNYFNEVHGYLYLKDRMHCEEVTFLREDVASSQKTPDLKSTRGTSVIVLEVKTINTSDDFSAHLERGVRDERMAPHEKPLDLDHPKTEKENPKGLENKIWSDIEHAKGQMANFHGAQKIALFVIDLDDCNIRDDLRRYLEEVDESHKELKIVAGLQSHWRPQNSGNKGLEWFYDK